MAAELTTTTLTVPDGTEDEGLQITGSSANSYRLAGLAITTGDTYTFSVWTKAAAATTVEFRVLGNLFTSNVTTAWQKVVFTVDEASTDYIDISPASDSALYLYKGMLQKGQFDTDWKPAPEDTETSVSDLTTRVSAAESSITQNADNIALKVSKNGVISAINQSAEEISIIASKISLEGVVTANGNFQIDTDGTMTCTNANVSGIINSNSGMIGGWTIGESSLYNGTDSLTSTTGGAYLGTDGVKFQDTNSDTKYSMLMAYNRVEYRYVNGNDTVSGILGSFGLNVTSKGSSLASTMSARQLSSSGTLTDETYIDPYGFYYVQWDSEDTPDNLVFAFIGRKAASVGEAYVRGKAGSTPKMSVYTDSNAVDLRVTSNGGIYHDGGLGGYSTSGWVVYVDSSGATKTNSPSDRRFKNDLGEITDDEASALLTQVKAINYTYKSDKVGIVQNGFFAQDIRDALVNNDIGYRSYLLIHKNGSDDDTTDFSVPEDEVNYGIDYAKLVPLVWKGWQMHHKTIQELSDKLMELERTCKEIKSQLSL